MRAIAGAIIVLAGTVILSFSDTNHLGPPLVFGALYTLFGWTAVLWRDGAKS